MRGPPQVKLLGRVQWKLVRELVVLGWPISVTIGVEIMLFGAGGLLVSTLGGTPLAAHQIALTVASLMFMVPQP